MTFRIILVLLLTLVYALTLASFDPADLVMGALLGTALLVIYRKTLIGDAHPQGEFVLHLIVYAPKLLWMLTRDILIGTWQVATFVVGIRALDNPGIVRIPLGNHSVGGVGVVGLFVTLSPGSFLVDIDWDAREMLIHFIDASNPDRHLADVEKYYKLWEYGLHLPPADDESRHRADQETR